MKHKIAISFLSFVISVILFASVSSSCMLSQGAFCYLLSLFLLIIMLILLITSMVFLVD